MNHLLQATSTTDIQCQPQNVTEFSVTPGASQPAVEEQFSFECVFYYSSHLSVQANNAYDAIEKAKMMAIDVIILSPDDPEASNFFSESLKPEANLIE